MGKYMNVYADKIQKSKSQTKDNVVAQMKTDTKSTAKLDDNRPEAIAQAKLQDVANNSMQVKQLKTFYDMSNNSLRVQQATQLQATSENNLIGNNQIIQQKDNNTGLPDGLKSGIENLSGYSMDDVKVYHNSDKPAQLSAHAYAQGSDIHLGSGQEKHLPHEAWHVVQQKQGRVKETTQMHGSMKINDDSGLEREADVMGSKALQLSSSSNESSGLAGIDIKAQTIQRKLVLNNAEIVAGLDLDTTVNGVYQNIVDNIDVKNDNALLVALGQNTVKVKRQLEKWIENAPGKNSASVKSHPEYGRKQQNRSYANLYDLARGLLGWVEAKPMRHVEKGLANSIYENNPLNTVLNGLLGKLFFKIHNLEEEGLVNHNKQQNILKELTEGLSIAKGAFDQNHRWTEDDNGGQRTKLGHYQRYHKTTADNDNNQNIAHNVPDNQLDVLQQPLKYTLKDKIILLHDLMEYFGRQQGWNPKTEGEGLLPVETRDETMVTTAVDIDGERTASVSMSDGSSADKKRARGMGLTTASRDEDAPSTILARQLKLPVWAGQSMTTVRMMKLAQWVGATELENSALAMGIFAYWRKDYDHRSDFAYHTLFEVLDVAKNFGVLYKMKPDQHTHPRIDIERVLGDAKDKYRGLVLITKQLGVRTKALNIGVNLGNDIKKLFDEISAMDKLVNDAYKIALDDQETDDERHKNLNIVVLNLENAVERQRQIKKILDGIPI